MKKRFSIVFLCALLVFSSCAHALSGTEIAVLKIGKADAIIITTAEHTILIDAGEEEDAEEILTFLASKRIQTLDAMIITHFDKDHVGGADGILEGIEVRMVYDADYESGSKQYGEYLDALNASGVERMRVSQPLELVYGGLQLSLMPAALETQDDNDNSLVISMADAWHTFLFAGDAEEARIDELLADGITPHNLLKMPHHGRMKDNLADFLDAVGPDIAIITDSDKNPADNETLALLSARGIDTYETRDGDIRVISSSSGLSVMQ